MLSFFNKKFLKAYSSVGRTNAAHNGFVVGSNPTRPIRIVFKYNIVSI